jgi:RNA polymerase sigma factor (TIGR02999 family)
MLVDSEVQHRWSLADEFSRMSDVTRLLEAVNRGERHAAADLLPLVYDELRRLAAAHMAEEKPGNTLDATALVHEAYLRLVGPAEDRTFAGRAHFFATAAEAMRRILVDRARARQALKRGGDGQRLAVDLDSLAGRYSDADMIDTDAVLDALATEDSDAAGLVRLHVFGGFSIEEAGQVLGMARSTAYRNWDYARAWLREALRQSRSSFSWDKSDPDCA